MVNTKIYNRIGKLLSVFAVMLAVAPALYTFIFAGIGKWAIPLSLAVPVLFLGAGYLLQAIVCKVIRRKPSFNDVNVEGVKLHYVDRTAIAFPALVCIAEGFGLYHLIIYILDSYKVIYDPYNLYLYLIPVFLVVFSLVGCIFWFIPYYKILPMDMLPVFFALFTLTFVFAFFLKVNSIFLTVIVIIFFPIFMVVNNLRSIEESIKHAKFRMPENGFRSYNFSLTVKYILVTLLVLAVAFSVFYAVYSNVNVKFSPIEQAKTEWKPRDLGSDSSGKSNADNESFEVDALLEEDNGGTTATQLISYIIVFGGLLFIIGYWLYKKNLLQRFFTLIKVIWQSFFEFITSIVELIGQIGMKNEYEAPLTYVDTEAAIDPYADYSAEYSEYKGLELLSIKEFDQILEQKESPEEKYAYAYATYCALIRIGDNGIKRSDTPRVLTEKLKAQRKADLGSATPVYEDIRYRLVKPEKGSEAELKALIKLVHSLLRTV